MHEICKAPGRAISSQVEKKVTFLCCIPKGTVLLAAEFDKDTFSPGVVVTAKVFVDNTRSSVDLSRVAFKLEHKVEAAGKVQVYSLANKAVAQITSGPVMRGNKVELVLDLQIPSDTTFSASGDAIKSFYRLKAKVNVPWSLSASLDENSFIFKKN